MLREGLNARYFPSPEVEGESRPLPGNLASDMKPSIVTTNTGDLTSEQIGQLEASFGTYLLDFIKQTLNSFDLEFAAAATNPGEVMAEWRREGVTAPSEDTESAAEAFPPRAATLTDPDLWRYNLERDGGSPLYQLYNFFNQNRFYCRKLSTKVWCKR